MDSNKPTAIPSSNGPLLTQNKIPSEMLASYQPQSDFEPLNNDFQQLSFDQVQGMMEHYNQFYQYQVPYYEPFVDTQTPFSTKFPRARDYNNEQAILETFPHLEGVNDANFDIESVSPDAQFYILRSGNDDNIHKAIKYHIWTTTTSGKGVLRQAWQDFEDNGKAPEIYLIFSVVNSNQFLGVAKMVSNVNDDDTFKYWWEPCKWFGTIQIKWLFIKDIHHSNFEHITEGDYNASIISFRDSTPISAETGKMILETFKKHPSQPNIFDSFEYMDRREDYIRAQRDHNPEYEKFFEESCLAYKNDPDSFQPQKKSYYPKKPAKKPANFSHKKHNANGNFYREKPAFFKKSEKWQNNKKPVNLEEQFVIKTENKKVELKKVKSPEEKKATESHKYEEKNGKTNNNHYYPPAETYHLEKNKRHEGKRNGTNGTNGVNGTESSSPFGHGK